MASAIMSTTTIIQNVAIEQKKSPSLTTFQASSDQEEYLVDRVNALRLIADSVAQQRQTAGREFIMHPITLAAAMALCALCSHFLDDLATIVTTTAGILMAGMAGVGYLTHEYLDLAERTGTWSFLRTDAATDKEDILILTRYGDEIVGVLVLRLVPLSDKKKKAKFTAVIRAWTVKQRYRNKTLGTALLEEALALCENNGWQGLEFASDHANSTRILPSMFHKSMDRREAKARILLAKLKREANEKK